jgi:signal transduction histidine kinase
VTRVDEPPKGGQIGPVIKDLEKTLLRIGERLNHFQRENKDLSSRLGLSIFEKNQIARILDSIHFGIIIMDAQDHVTHVNDFMLKFLNRKREDVLDHPLQEVLIHDEIRYVLSQWEAMGQGGNANHLEVSFPEVAPGEIFQISFSHVADSDKSPLCKMIFLRNITSEKLSDEANHKFIAHVAHELFTPLTNIKSYNEMLMDGEVKDGEMQKEFYNTINEETNRLSRLIQNLLDISKIEMGSLTINKGLVRTDWFVDSCVSPIEASARDKKITLVKNLPDTFPFLIADKELLKAAIINILGNAVKYTPENGKITYSIYEQDNMVVFDVIDTGYGISEEDLSHVFEKFYRSQDPQITAQAGSGLGMAIASEIVHLHDGEIDVKSKPGEGTYFTIRIPKEDYQVGKQ